MTREEHIMRQLESTMELKDVIKGQLIDLLANYETCHICYSWDLANILAGEIISRKPWWWLINICNCHYREIMDDLKRYHLPKPKGDTTDWAKLAITIEVSEILATCDAVIDTWHTYADDGRDEMPAMLTHGVARCIAMDIVFMDN